MKYPLLILLFVIFNNDSLAQSKVVLFFNENWELTDKSSHKYYRECEYDLNNFRLNGEVKDYFNSGSLAMLGQYNKGKKTGDFIFYYPNGEVESTGPYQDNSRIGEWKFYFRSGELKMIVSFPDPTNILDFSVLELYDSLGNKIIKNGSGKWVDNSIRIGMFDKESSKSLKGRFKNGKKHGKWELIRNSDKKLWHVEKFNNGMFLGADIYNAQMDYYGTINTETLNKFPDKYYQKFKSSELFSLDTSVYDKSLIYKDVETIFKSVTGIEHKIQNRKAGYPYGDYSLLEYIATNIKYPLSALRSRHQGTVYVNVTINDKGKATDIIVLKKLSPELDSEAIRVIKQIDQWMPELQAGKPVSSKITIPVKFQIKE
jgi:TonB family protein